MAWLEADALLQFRRLLGDLPTDKYVFKSQAVPSADGTTVEFFTGDQNLVSGTLKVFVDGVESSPAPTPDLTNGTFVFATAPVAEVDIQASYQYQWFSDLQLGAFLLAGANVIGVETIDAEDLGIGLRPAVLSFSAYFAYMKKAGEHADSLEAAAEGFTVNQGKSFPNWKRMAENAWAQGKDALQFYNDNILAVGGIGMKITAYRMPDYMPQS